MLWCCNYCEISMALLGHSRTNAIPIIGKIPIDSEFTDEEYENASNYYDDNRHFLARVAINTSIILSIMVSLSASLRMWNLDRSNGQNLRPNNYVLMTFGFSLLCLIFMVLINL